MAIVRLLLVGCITVQTSPLFKRYIRYERLSQKLTLPSAVELSAIDS
jgi:hypothetical protein